MEKLRHSSQGRKRDRHWSRNLCLSRTPPQYLGIICLFVKPKRHASDGLTFQPYVACRDFKPDPLSSFRKAAHVAPSLSSRCSQFGKIATPECAAPDCAVV